MVFTVSFLLGKTYFSHQLEECPWRERHDGPALMFAHWLRLLAYFPAPIPADDE